MSDGIRDGGHYSKRDDAAPAAEPTVPLSEHQRLQAEAAAREAALERVREREAETMEAVRRLLVGRPDHASDCRCPWCGLAFAAGQALDDARANPLPLSSSAGSALLAEMEEMRKERGALREGAEKQARVHAEQLADVRAEWGRISDELRAKLNHLQADRDQLARMVDAADRESATLRSRLETVERERDDLRESFCPAHRKPEHWDDASCEVCLEHELRIERQDHASEVRRAVEEAVAKEREACARVAEDDLGEHRDLVPAAQRFDGGASERAAQRIAAAIRARGGK